MGYKWQFIFNLFKPKIGWESRRKIGEDLTILREKITSKGEINKKEFEDMKKDLE